MQCPECGADNRAGARFCDGCGARLSAVEVSETRRTVLEQHDIPAAAASP